MGFRSLSDSEWNLIQESFPKQRRGRPRQWSDRDCLNAVLYLLYSGSRWNDLPKEYPPSTTVYDRYSLWLKQGVLKKALTRLRKRIPTGKIFYLDATVKSSKKGDLHQPSGENQGHKNQPRHRRNRVAS